MTDQIHIAQLMLEYAMSLGVRAVYLKETPGLWEHKIDERWTIKLNPHQEEVDDVPGLSRYIEYNGWPAGVISVLGEGMLCAGEGGNEESLRKAIESKYKKP